MLVPVNNKNYEQHKALSVIILAKNTFTNQYGVIILSFNVAQSRPDSRDLYWYQRNDRDLNYKRSRQI